MGKVDKCLRDYIIIKRLLLPAVNWLPWIRQNKENLFGLKKLILKLFFQFFLCERLGDCGLLWFFLLDHLGIFLLNFWVFNMSSGLRRRHNMISVFFNWWLIFFLNWFLWLDYLKWRSVFGTFHLFIVYFYFAHIFYLLYRY